MVTIVTADETIELSRATRYAHPRQPGGGQGALAVKIALARCVAVGYVGLALGLAVTGDINQTPLPLLLDVAWTLPTGIVAFLSVYFVYGIASQVGPLFGASSENGAWLTVVNDVYIVLAFTCAAVIIVLLVPRRQLHRREQRLSLDRS